MKQYDTYIFDLDGTLLNTLADLANSCNYALTLMGMPERSIDEVRMFVGNGVAKLMERAVPADTSNEEIARALRIFKEHYMVHGLDTTRPYEGIMDLLQRLHDDGKRVAVVSNKFYDATVELCRHFFGDLVEVAIGERSDILKKPAPDTVVEALRQLDVSRNGAVYIGDSEVDIQTAENVGIPCISVLWGFRDKAFLKEIGGKIFVEKPEEIYFGKGVAR